MKTKSIILTIAMVILILGSSQDAFCKWKTQTLPGMEEDNSGTTALLIAGGVILTGAIVYFVIKKKKKKKSTSFLYPQSIGAYSSISFYEKMKNAGEQSPVQLFVGKSNFDNQLSNNNFSTPSVGLRFKF